MFSSSFPAFYPPLPGSNSGPRTLQRKNLLQRQDFPWYVGCSKHCDFRDFISVDVARDSSGDLVTFSMNPRAPMTSYCFRPRSIVFNFQNLVVGQMLCKCCRGISFRWNGCVKHPSFFLVLDDNVRPVCLYLTLRVHRHIPEYCDFVVSLTVAGWCLYHFSVVSIL